MSPTICRVFFTISLLVSVLQSPALFAVESVGLAVSATGSSQAMPDLARFSVTFQQTSNKVRDAQSNVDKHVNELMTKLSTYKLEQDSIDTSHTRVNPIYTYTDGERKLQGYEVSRSIQFETKALDQIESVISTLTSSKVSRLDAIRFDLEDQTEARAAALSDAINQSKKAAEQLASGYDVQLGPIVSIEHTVEDYRHPAPIQARALMAETANKADNSYQIRALNFKARVAVTYSIN